MHSLRKQHTGITWLALLLVLALLLLVAQFVGPKLWERHVTPILEQQAKYALRNADFSDTHISLIHLDLTSPNHYVTLTWAGPAASEQETGPFRSSPGAGLGYNDCNDPVESNCPGSQCTPKGRHTVEGFLDHFRQHPESRYVTLFDEERRIGFHSQSTVPAYPASQGCVRLEPHAARLIHNNSIEGKTEVLVEGTWTNPTEVQRKYAREAK